MEYVGHWKSPLGGITMACDGQALTGIWFDGQKYFPKDLLSRNEQLEHPVFDRTREWLILYFQGQVPTFTPPLAPRATPFRKAVWEILLEIPYGRVTTYGEIARRMAARLGRPSMSAQAVGGAVGHNPISIIIPCHRVVGSSGSLTGYAGGLEKKAALLALEGADLQHLLTDGAWNTGP